MMKFLLFFENNKRYDSDILPGDFTQRKYLVSSILKIKVYNYFDGCNDIMIKLYVISSVDKMN